MKAMAGVDMSPQLATVVTGADDVARCRWATETGRDLTGYHDQEWGTPTHDEAMLTLVCRGPIHGSGQHRCGCTKPNALGQVKAAEQRQNAAQDQRSRTKPARVDRGPTVASGIGSPQGGAACSS